MKSKYVENRNEWRNQGLLYGWKRVHLNLYSNILRLQATENEILANKDQKYSHFKGVTKFHTFTTVTNTKNLLHYGTKILFSKKFLTSSLINIVIFNIDKHIKKLLRNP